MAGSLGHRDEVALEDAGVTIDMQVDTDTTQIPKDITYTSKKFH